MSIPARVAAWICPTDFDRARLVENEGPARVVGMLTSIAVGVALLCAVPELGWWPIEMLALASVSIIVERVLADCRYPELLIAGASLFSMALVCAVVAGTGGAHSILLPWLMLPVIGNAPRFRPQVLLCVTVLMFVLFAGALVVVGDYQSFKHPLSFVVLCALFVSVTAGAYVLTTADVFQRSAAVLDGLTGLLNRKTLKTRAAELAAQAELTGEPLGCIVVDVDFFKSINDEFGHEQGDVVLRQIAYELRKELGAFELLYRLGGEEFLALLPGRGLAMTMGIAERIRLAAARVVVGGRAVTLSVGVAAAEGGKQPIDIADLLRRADGAMYTAKRNGRNRVSADGRYFQPVAPRSPAEDSERLLTER